MSHFKNHLNHLNQRNPGSDNDNERCFPHPLDTPYGDVYNFMHFSFKGRAKHKIIDVPNNPAITNYTTQARASSKSL
ncbi:hypothetical protein MHK_005522 [Candidatus Magnetomorum sp. HK-1]|nr:hypothetical protein MHK_005522 [Candidatus Magnetomorum sp. HK-1]